MMTASGVRTSFGVYVKPMEVEFGWSRAALSEAAAISLFAHQVGAAFGAALAGWVFEAAGSYTTAFISAAVVAFVGGALTLFIREEPVGSRPTPTPVAV